MPNTAAPASGAAESPLRPASPDASFPDAASVASVPEGASLPEASAPDAAPVSKAESTPGEASVPEWASSRDAESTPEEVSGPEGPSGLPPSSEEFDDDPQATSVERSAAMASADVARTRMPGFP